MTDPLPRAVGYTRVSTRGQAVEGLSLDAQAAKIRAYCELHDLDLREIISDAGASGKSLNGRPGMEQALALVRDGQVAALVCWRMDRAFRNMREALETIDFFTECDARFISVEEQWDTGRATGRFLRQMMLAIGELQRGQISENTREALQSGKQITNPANAALLARMRSGKILNGRAPYGYRWKNGTLVTHRYEQMVMAKIAKLAEYNTYKDIAHGFTAYGVKPKRGGEWHAKQVSRAHKMWKLQEEMEAKETP